MWFGVRSLKGLVVVIAQDWKWSREWFDCGERGSAVAVGGHGERVGACEQVRRPHKRSALGGLECRRVPASHECGAPGCRPGSDARRRRGLGAWGRVELERARRSVADGSNKCGAVVAVGGVVCCASGRPVRRGACGRPPVAFWVERGHCVTRGPRHDCAHRRGPSSVSGGGCISRSAVSALCAL